MPNTYAIHNDIDAAEQLIAQTYDAETGEITGDYEAAEKLRAEVQALGLETLCKARANRLALIANIKAEEERLKARRQRLKRGTVDAWKATSMRYISAAISGTICRKLYHKHPQINASHNRRHFLR